MTVFSHGSQALIEKCITGTEGMQPLRLHHLPRLSRDDVIISPRPWSHLLESLVLFRNSSRPRIVQVADGVVFPLNANKAINARYGGLQKFIFSDCFIARQNVADFDFLSSEPRYVLSATEIDIAVQRQSFSVDAAILVAGNDPFFDFPKYEVVSDFIAAAERLRGLGVKRVLLSSPNSQLEKQIRSAIPWVRSVGRIKDYSGDIGRTLLIGSPSTVLLEHQQRGGLSLLLVRYDDPVLRRYMSLDKLLNGLSPPMDGLFSVEALTFTRTASKQFELKDILSTLERRSTKELPLGGMFFKNVYLKQLLREVQLLLGAKA